MPFLETSLLAIVRTLENDTELAEALLFPEFSRFGAKRKRLVEAVRHNAERILDDLPAVAVHQRQLAGAVEVRTVELDVEPRARTAAWREPVRLRFHALVWDHGGHAQIAYVPALEIAVIAPTPEEMAERLERHIRTHLLRLKSVASLERLVWLQRERAVEVRPIPVTLLVRTPKQIAKESLRERPRPVIEEVGQDLGKARLPETYELDEVVERLGEPLSARRPRSVLLVGPSGVGKTAAVYELVWARRKLGIGRAPVWATSGSRLVAGMSGFGMWQERCQRLVAEASKAKAILYVGNLVELLDVGKSVSNNQGIASFLRGYIARGEILAIAECTPEQLARIERDDPRLLDAFLRVDVPGPGPALARAILARRATALGLDTRGDWLETLDRLHRRYATYSAQPGRPLRFLESLAADRTPGEPLTSRDVTAAFSRETGLPLLLLEESIPLDLEQTRAWLTSRVMGQPAAVDLVVDLLASVKAGLTRPRRPVASLLFIGPTGVGKTEMAKSLAEFLFGSRDRAVRFDMSEYADPRAVARLVGGTWSSEGLLTAKIREQPFSVVLLDEFEKADPAFFDLLLQVLGEGRLTDGAGRVADFSNAVVVMTSNLGAESFQRGSVGFRDERARFGEIARHFEDEVRAFVRPELFNRIDRIVPFGPLDEATVEAIAARELDDLARRDGIASREVRLEIEAEVGPHLARAGFDARYGARPLRRAVERELLVPLADELNQQPPGRPLVARVAVSNGRVAVRVRAVEGAVGAAARAAETFAEAATFAADLRRDAQALDGCPAVLESRNEVYRLEQLERRLKKRTWRSPDDVARIARVDVVRPVVDAVAAFLDRAVVLEEQAVFAWFGRVAADEPALSAEVSAMRREWTELLLRVYELRFPRAKSVTLEVYGDAASRVRALAGAYYEAAVAAGLAVDVATISLKRAEHARLEPVDPAEEPAPAAIRANPVLFATSVPLVRERVERVDELFATPRAGIVGFVLEMIGRFARARFEPERGLHVFVAGDKLQEVVVRATDAGIADYVPPDGAARKGGLEPGEKRRVYDTGRALAEDCALERWLPWPHQDLVALVARASDELLIASARALLEPGEAP